MGRSAARDRTRDRCRPAGRKPGRPRRRRGAGQAHRDRGPRRGELAGRGTGSLVADRPGAATGYAIYNLYQEKDHADISTLEQDYPIDYFAPVFVLKSGVIIPKPAMQKRLLAVIMSDRYKHLHNPAYSVFANPLENRYQNCTGFVLNVVQSAIYDSDDPRVILANNRKYFEPQKVDIGGMRLLLARMFMDEVRTDDQHGPIRTTTFSSIARYMEQYGLADRVTVVTDQ